MESPKLRITSKKYTGESSIVSVRIPKDMLRDIDAVATMTGRTRNEIMTTSLEFALEHMDVQKSKE